MASEVSTVSSTFPLLQVNVGGVVIPDWEAIITGIVLSAITLLTVAGNSLVVLCVLMYRPLRIAPNYFIVSLAATDITVALLVYPFGIVYCMKGRWIFSADLCQLWVALNVMCCSVSILHLLVIAADRYWAIKSPIEYLKKRTLRRILSVIVLLWCLSGVMSSFLLIGGKDLSERIKKFSICTLRSYYTYVVTVCITLFYVILFFTTVMYARLFITVRRRFRDRARSWVLSLANTSPGTTATGIQDQSEGGKGMEEIRLTELHDNIPETEESRGDREGKRVCVAHHAEPESKTVSEDENSKSGAVVTISTGVVVVPSSPCLSGRARVHKCIDKRPKTSREKRLAKTLGLVMGAFLLCWLPFFIMYLVMSLCDSCRPSLRFRNFITWLGYFNSTLNPIIYTIFNQEFRRGLKKVLRLKS